MLPLAGRSALKRIRTIRRAFSLLLSQSAACWPTASARSRARQGLCTRDDSLGTRRRPGYRLSRRLAGRLRVGCGAARRSRSYKASRWAAPAGCHEDDERGGSCHASAAPPCVCFRGTHGRPSQIEYRGEKKAGPFEPPRVLLESPCAIVIAVLTILAQVSFVVVDVTLEVGVAVPLRSLCRSRRSWLMSRWSAFRPRASLLRS